MMKSLFLLLNKMSSYFKFDILWHICSHLPLPDRYYLAWRIFKDDVEEFTFRRQNTLWTGHGWDGNIMCLLLIQGSWQSEEIEAILCWMNHYKRITAERNIIIDVGANIGTSSIPFAQRSNCHIVAIEPIPENYSLLLKNVHQNGLQDRITCVQKAISTCKGTIEMVLPRYASGGARIKDSQPYPHPQYPHDYNIRRFINVPADGLMNIVKAYHYPPQRIAFVWCDIEGSEGKVIESGEKLWQNGVPLYIEVNPLALKRQDAIHSLTGLASRYFDRYVVSDDLKKTGPAAPVYSISQLSSLLDQLDRKNGLMDILLLPKEHGE